MPRFILRTCLALLLGLCVAFPGCGFRELPEPDEWPTLQFRIFGPNDHHIVYRTSNGTDFPDGKTLIREKAGQVTTLNSPIAVDIRGYTPTDIHLPPISPHTETVLLIDQIYDPDLPYGGITKKSHIIRETPRSGWAQRFLYNLEIERFWQKMNDGLMSDQERELHNSTIGSKYPTIYLMLEPYEFTLPPGKHTLQVLMLNADGTPMNPPITSRYATVFILPPDINYWPIILSLAGLLLLVALAIDIIKYHRGRPLSNRP